MREKNKLLCSLTCFVIIFSLALPALSAVVQASPSTSVWDWYDLDAVRDDLGDHYVLMNNLDAATAGYTELASAAANDGRGWQPIGPWPDGFGGYFEGQGYEISDLVIRRPGEDNVGLFGRVDEGGVVVEVGIVNVAVTGRLSVGGLVGSNSGTVSNAHSVGAAIGYASVGGLVGTNSHTVLNSYASGSATGKEQVGGLVGFNDGSVSNSYSTATVTADLCAGGLVASNSGTVSESHSIAAVTGYISIGGLVASNAGIVKNSYSAGSVTGKEQAGGLIGRNRSEGAVSNSHSAARVTGGSYIGGLVGWNDEGGVTDSCASGSVTGEEYIGGLVGWNDMGTIGSSYSAGGVTGEGHVGGLVGWNDGGVISNSYSTGRVTGEGHIGGLVGENHLGTVSNSFWDVETSEMEESSGGTGKTTAEMQNIATFTDIETEGLDDPWDMIAVVRGETDDDYAWNIVDGDVYPFFSWEQPPVPLHNLAISNTAGGSVTATVNEEETVIGSGETETISDIPVGTEVKLVASPDTGYEFVEWVGQPLDGVPDPVTAITMQGDYEITASFEAIPIYTLTITDTRGGWVTTPGVGNFTHYAGTVVILVATPADGYRFVRWTGDVDAIADAEAALTTVTMEGDYSIAAYFRTLAGCFIATAAYGTPMAQEIQVLRAFRDEYLLTNPVGKAMVEIYYSISPPIADVIAEHPSLKPTVRAILAPAVVMSTVVVNTTAAEKMAVMGLLALISAAVAAWTMRGRCRHPEQT